MHAGDIKSVIRQLNYPKIHATQFNKVNGKYCQDKYHQLLTKTLGGFLNLTNITNNLQKEIHEGRDNLISITNNLQTLLDEGSIDLASEYKIQKFNPKSAVCIKFCFHKFNKSN